VPGEGATFVIRLPREAPGSRDGRQDVPGIHVEGEP
jgi:hypothetical protein